MSETKLTVAVLSMMVGAMLATAGMLPDCGAAVAHLFARVAGLL